MTDGLAPLDGEPTTRLPSEDRDLKLGAWYWVKDDDGRWLACIVHLGSNYAQMKAPNGSGARVHFDEFDSLCTPEPNHKGIIEERVESGRRRVADLMGRIRQLSAALGIVPRARLPEEGEQSSQALAVAHGVADVQAHKQALIKAKDETLPELFKLLTSEHEKMATWMKAELLPMQAELSVMEGVTDVIKNRIFTVELYAGLTEELVQIAEGDPAPNDTKVHLFQRRHYMDEECLVQYTAGGMEFKNIGEFDRWLLKKANRHRLLPLPRCVVAFRVRRNDKDRKSERLNAFIRLNLEEADKATFLYVRNGDQVFRLSTQIDFGEQLFPERERSALLGGGALWIKMSMGHSFGGARSQADYEEHRAYVAEQRAKHAKAMKEWKKNGKKGHRPWDHMTTDTYESCTPDNVFYDDAMKQVAKAAVDHNRVAVVLQGLLDRSPAFHPHPPWQLWRNDGFAQAVELVYDDSKALTPGEAPDFEAYRARLNATLTRGSLTVGQERQWLRAEAKKEMDRRSRDWRIRGDLSYELETFKPYGNDGPGLIAEVKRLGRDGSCHYEWERKRLRPGWVSNPDKPGWMKRDSSTIRSHFECPSSKLLNVSAYTPGDFKVFYSDPRTRQDYLKWAPLLLAAEDHYGDKK